jgi:hypothetical protein
MSGGLVTRNPDQAPAPPKQSRKSVLKDIYGTDQAFRWVLCKLPWVLGVLAVIWALLACAIGRHWKTAYDLLLGAVAPSSVGQHYWAAALIAAIGYFLLPALIGVVATVVIYVAAKIRSR